MDSLTQIVLGIGVGEAYLGKKVGNKTLLWGAALATLPDMDVFPGLLLETVDRMAIHRGFSHSLLFFICASPLIGWAVHSLHKKKEATIREWAIFAFLVMSTHGLLDSFTSWGTQLFWPHPYRVAFHTIFVADPLYTVPLLLSIVLFAWFRRGKRARRWINRAGLIVSSAYLLLTVVNKSLVDPVFRNLMSDQGLEVKRYQTKPMPLNNILWWVLAETDEAYYFGYYSMLDSEPPDTLFRIEKNHELLSEIGRSTDIDKLIWMTDGYFNVERRGEGWTFNDVRFGKAADFGTGEGHFVFSFLIDPGPGDEREIRMSPREENMPKEGDFAMLWDRMLGH